VFSAAPRIRVVSALLGPIGFNQFGLSLLYQFTPLKIEWIGLIVVG
jgi:hypothetical protein